jgi:hypothetical protein
MAETVIPDAAVEAAAKAIHAMWMAPDGVSWDADQDAQDAYTSEAQVALEAAAPHLLNLAKREAWDANLEIQRLRAELAKAAK